MDAISSFPLEMGMSVCVSAWECVYLVHLLSIREIGVVRLSVFTSESMLGCMFVRVRGKRFYHKKE